MVAAGAALAGFLAGAAVGAWMQRRAAQRAGVQRGAAVGQDAPNRAAAGSGAGGGAGLFSNPVGGAVPFAFDGGEVDGRSFERHMAWTEAQTLGGVVGKANHGYRPTTREREERRRKLYGG